MLTVVWYWSLTTFGRVLVRDIILLSSTLALVSWCWFTARMARAAVPADLDSQSTLHNARRRT